MTRTQFYTSLVLVAFAMFALALFTVSGSHKADASAFPGGRATGYIATTTSVGPGNATQLFAQDNACSSRVVTTVAQPVMLSFFDPTNGDLSSTTLSGTKGFLQAASTTVAYDSGIYGCGRMFAYGFGASTTITTMETQ